MALVPILSFVLFVASFDSSSIYFDDESKEATNENLRLNAMSTVIRLAPSARNNVRC